MKPDLTQKPLVTSHSRVGRWVHAEGNDYRDASFYEESMGLSEEQEQRDLAHLRDLLLKKSAEA